MAVSSPKDSPVETLAATAGEHAVEPLLRRLGRVGVAVFSVAFVVLLLADGFVYAWPVQAERWVGGAVLGAAAASTKVLYGAVVLLAALAAAAWLHSTHSELKRTRRRAQAVDTALESLALGVAVWDHDDRLVFFNPAFVTLYAEIAPEIVPGARYEHLMRLFFERSPASVRQGRDYEQFFDDHQARRRGSRFGVADWMLLREDRRVLMIDSRLGDGAIVSFRMPVTGQGAVDVESIRRRRVMEDLADLAYDWYWRTDAEGRLVEFSTSMPSHLQYDKNQLLGRTLSQIPGFEAAHDELLAYERSIADRAPFSWFRFQARRGDDRPVSIAVAGKPIIDTQGHFGGYYGAGRDVTESEATLAALRRSEERFRGLTALATEWYWETDAELRLTLVRGPADAAEALEPRLVGRALRAVAQHPGFDLDWPLVNGYLRRRVPFRRVPLRVQHDELGRRSYFELSAEPVFYRGEFVGYRGLCWDVTEREALIAQLIDSEARFRALTELSSDWYWEMDARLCFTRVRRGPRGGFNFSDEEVIGKQRWEMPGELIFPANWDEHRATLGARQPFRDLMIRRVDADGSIVYHVSSGDPVFDADGTFRGYRGVGKNITEQVRAQERIERLATIDPLTQLPNRQTFDERASRALAMAYARSGSCAMLFLDLDNFRLLNNGYGHRVGDQVLAETAERMRRVIGEPHLLGRRGGDELVALLVDLPRIEAAAETAQALIRSISEPMRVLGMEVSVTPSVGISLFPQDGVDLDSLLNASDAAMYQAKESGRKTYAMFTSAVARRVDLRLRLEQKLRKAVESRDFKLFYQPLVSLGDGKMIGAEALIRWKDVELGDISPAEFIPIAEESGLIVGLGDWVIREACRARQVWRQLGLDIPPVALNFSGVQLRQLGCVEKLLDTLGQFDVPPGEIEVEVTETGLLDTSAVARENLVRLRNAGIKLALDDFGVGFSSLAHLRDLPIHRLKIDRSFTVECMRDARTLTIVKAVVEMARSLGISVTAEGIETQAQQTWMQHLGCDSAQGYLFARPLPVEEFIRLFIDRRGVGRERSLMH